LTEEPVERAADQSEAETGARGGRAVRVLRAIAAVVIMAVGCIGAVMVVDPGGSWFDFGMALADLFGMGEYVGVGLLALFLMAPVALLAGIIARPRWWLPATVPLALGCLVWAVLAPQAAARDISDDSLLAWVLQVGGTLVALAFGFLGARMSAGKAGTYVAVAFGTVWLGALLVSAGAAGGMFWQTGAGVWLLTVSVEVAVFAMLLAAYWTRDPGRWWLLGIGGTLWLIGVAIIAGAAAWFGWTGELEWYMPWLLASLGTAWLGLLAFVAAAGRRWRIGGSVPFGRAVFLVGILAVLGLGAVVKGYAPGRVLSGEPVYARLGVSPGVEVYFQFDESGMRVARSAQELAAAEPVAAVERDGTRAVFPAVDLPIEADELPAGCKQLRAKPEVRSFGGSVWGRRSLDVDMMCVVNPAFVYEDERGAEWTYWVGGAGMEAGTSPQRAGVGEMALPERPTVEVTAQVGRGGEDHVGLAIAVQSGEMRLLGIENEGEAFEMRFLGIEKDGEAVEATLVVLDSGGSTVVTKRGTLEDLGFT